MFSNLYLYHVEGSKMKPSEKHPVMEALLDQFAASTFGRSRSGSIAGDVCISCDNPATSFKDELSAKEFSISGLCQNCQDDVFGT